MCEVYRYNAKIYSTDFFQYKENMKIGFVGKGGSGKSTLSTLFIKYLEQSGKKVLAIDADYNMDLTNNLKGPKEMQFIGAGMPDVLAHIEKGYNTTHVHGPECKHEHELLVSPEFALSPLDTVSEKYSFPVSEHVRLMSAGPITKAMLQSQNCNHELIEALKVYLPFLKLQKDEFAVIDERAGIDGLSTGVTSGFDVAVVVVEATENSMRVGKQIIDLLEFFGTKYLFVLNKVVDEAKEIDMFMDFYKNVPDVIVPFEREPSFAFAEKILEKMVQK